MCSMESIAARGEVIHSSDSSGTGHIASLPCRGSLMIELTKLDAAAFGFPGRTATVGRRMIRPSQKPLRL